jgi:protein SCO1
MHPAPESAKVLLGMTTPDPSTPPAPRRRIRGRMLFAGIIGVLLLIVVPTIVLPTLVFRKPAPQLDDYGELPPFTLVTEGGQTITREQLRGHVTIVDFIFTRCDTLCPILSGRMARIQEMTADVGTKIKLASFTVDPEHDTPEVLAAYARGFGADSARWVFITGDSAEIRRTIEQGLMAGYDTSGTLPSGAPDINHSGHFILLDKDVHIRGIYHHSDTPRVDAMLRHARWLARQPSRPVAPPLAR